MLLDFKIDKAIAATGFLIEQGGGTADMFPLIKKLYLADRSALIQWGNSITGASLASLQKGPIVSTIYDLMKGTGDERNLNLWNAAIWRDNYALGVRSPIDKSVLSERESTLLDESRRTIDNIRGSIPDWCHANFPEWIDPGTSSTPIDPSSILRVVKKSEEEILQIEKDNEELRYLDRLLNAS
jgi:hypothetical protein